MDVLSYSSARANLASAMTKVCDDHEPVIITRNKAPNVVMMSQADYDSLQETLYLLGNRKNAEMLFQSLEELRKGKTVAKEIKE